MVALPAGAAHATGSCSARMRRAIKEEMILPIYPVSILLCVSEKVREEREKMNEVFGKFPGSWGAICSKGKSGNFGIFFHPDSITHRQVAHEIMHLTVWILDYCGIKVTAKSDEAAAYLCGFLTDWVYRRLGKFIKK